MGLAHDIDQIVASEVMRTGAGASIAIVRAGSVVLSNGCGTANLEWDAPATPETVFPIASISKPITAMAVMMLVERGAIGLDDQVARYLPTSAVAGATIRQLLSHTAGLAAPPADYWRGDRQRSATEAEVRAAAIAHACDAVPGARHVYSNIGYTLLSFIIDEVVAEGYRGFVREQIFKPLDMARTVLLHDRALITQRASGYCTGPFGLENAHTLSFTWSRGAGGIASTVGDIAKLDAALRENRLVRAASLEAMLVPVRLLDGTFYPYGLGWGVDEFCGHNAHAHTGGLAGYVGEWMRAPSADAAVIVLANHADFRFHKVACAAMRAVLGAGPCERHPRPLSRETGRIIQGRYQKSDGVEIILSYDDEALTCTGWALNGRLSLSADGTLFNADDPEPEGQLEYGADGSVQSITFKTPMFAPTRFDRSAPQ